MRLSVFIFLLFVSTFASAQITYSTAKFGTDMFSNSTAVGDFDRDGHLDVASMDGADGLLTIFHGGPGGSLTQTVQYQIPADLRPAFVQTADLDGDGNLDLVIGTDNFDTPSLEIWNGNGDGTFHLNQVLSIDSPSPEFALGDVNGDGTVDLITVQNSAVVVLYTNDGHENFTRGSVIDASVQRIQRFAAGDFNRDGKLDVLLSSGNALLMFPGRGDGTFGAPVTSPTTGTGQGTIAVGSFNHDSNLDVALRTNACGACNDTKFLIFLNNGAGKFTLAGTVTAGHGTGSEPMAAGDLNNDGVMDLVISNSGPGATTIPNSVQYLLNDGTGHFGAAQTVTATSLRPWLPSLRHFNRDSQLDIIVAADSVYRFLARNAPTNCTPPSPASLSATLCTPAASASVPRTFTVRAAGDSPAGVVRMELWIDGKKSFENWGDQLKHTITVSAGAHRVVIHSIDRYRGFGVATAHITAK